MTENGSPSRLSVQVITMSQQSESSSVLVWNWLSHFRSRCYIMYYTSSQDCEKKNSPFLSSSCLCIFCPAECFLRLLVRALSACWMKIIEVIYSNVQGTLMKWWLNEKCRSSPNSSEWVAKRWQVITLPSCHFRCSISSCFSV